MKSRIEKLETCFNKLNLPVTSTMIQQFLDYYQLLIEWNKVMNLTAITDFDEVIEKHFMDSISLGTYLSFSTKESVIDLGTGAGFPGIPLKIVFPELDILLADSLNKRVSFLNEVITKLNLKNISAVHGRAEDLAKKPEYREKFDFCVSRAVAHLSVLSEYCVPFVKIGGQFIAYKGEVDEELKESENAISLLGGSILSVKKFYLPDTDYHRSFVFVRKVKDTPKKYPRKAGTPAKQPLIYTR